MYSMKELSLMREIKNITDDIANNNPTMQDLCEMKLIQYFLEIHHIILKILDFLSIKCLI